MIITCKCGRKFDAEFSSQCRECRSRQRDIVDVAIDAGIAAMGASLLSSLSHSDDSSSSSSSSSSSTSGGGGDFGGGGASGDY